MDIKETEKILEQSAKNIKVRDFSEVWQEIKGELEVEEKPKKKVWAKRYMPAILSACIVLIIAISLPIFLLNPQEQPEKIFYLDKLVYSEVDETSFFNELSSAKVTHVSFSKYLATNCKLYKTDTNVAKGGAVDLYDDMSAPTEVIKIKFYDISVNLDDSDSEKVYELSYSKEGLSVSYNNLPSYPEYNIYSYDIIATFNKVNYFIEYMGNASNPETFFESFFK